MIQVRKLSRAHTCAFWNFYTLCTSKPQTIVKVCGQNKLISKGLNAQKTMFCPIVPFCIIVKAAALSKLHKNKVIFQQHFNLKFYRVRHGFRLTKRDDYFGVNFDYFWIFRGSWGNIQNWLEPKIEPFCETLCSIV